MPVAGGVVVGIVRYADLPGGDGGGGGVELLMDE